MNLLFEIAWTHVSTRVRQTIVASLGVASGIAITIMMAALMIGDKEDFVRTLVDSIPHVTVSAERRTARLQPAEEVYAAAQSSSAISTKKLTEIKNPKSVIEQLRSWLPGAVAPSVKTTVMLQTGQENVGVTLVGIDPRFEQDVSKLPSQMKSGRIEDLYKASNALLIGEALAKKAGLKVGSGVNISTSEGMVVPGSIVGIYSTGQNELDEAQVFGLIRTAQVLSGQPGVINELRIRLRDAGAAPEIAKRVGQLTGYKAVSWQEANADLMSVFVVRDIIMIVIMSAMMFASTLGIYSIISTITQEKRRDIAIMKSFGMKAGLVLSIFLVESAIMGILGVVIGWGLGYVLCRVLTQVTIANPITGAAVPLPLAFEPTHYIIVAAISLAACLAASFIPSQNASRLLPVDIIRGVA
jgi:lipoprotein-releasing system permease protein